jgi:anti-anti-sigma factor
VESRPTDLSSDIWVVLPQGRLDAQAAPALEQELSALEAKSITHIIVNFGQTRYVSSSTLRVLIIHLRRLQQGGGDLRLCCLTAKVAEVLQITGLDSVFDIFPSEELAALAFSGTEDASTGRPDMTSTGP